MRNYNLNTLFFWFALYLIIPFTIWDDLTVFELGIFSSLNYLITAFSLAYYSDSKNDAVIQTTFWVFVYIFLVISPVVQESYNVFPWIDNYSASTVDFSRFIVFLGCLFYFLGSFSRSRNKQYSFSFSELKMKYFIVIAPALTVFSLAAHGGFNVIFLSREEVSSIFGGDVAKTMILQSFLRVPLFVLSLWFLMKLFSKLKSKNAVIFDYFLFFATASLTLIINNPISTARFWIACIALTYLFLLLRHFAFRLNRLFSLLLIFLTIYIFPISDAFRRSTDVSLADYAAEQNVREGFAYSANYDAFQQIVNSVVFVEQNGFSFGHQIISALFFWVPRSIWPNKANSTGEMLAVNAMYDYSNLSSPVWAEVYVDFGVVGVCFLFYILGRFSKRLDMSNGKDFQIIAIFIASYNIYLLRGSLMSVIGLLFIFMVTLFLLRNKH